MPIDHTSVAVSDYEAAKAFFAEALKPLEYKLVMEVPGPGCGFGAPCDLMQGQLKPDFWLSAANGKANPVHIAFEASSRKQVDDWYQAAMAAGAKDNGAPGLRPQYHPNYYGAFVKDPVDGNNIEAVCHKPE
jgi:catechol 2,3-dioxygenase-like lactoylglutathione lyase family enzyme